MEQNSFETIKQIIYNNDSFRKYNLSVNVYNLIIIYIQTIYKQKYYIITNIKRCCNAIINSIIIPLLEQTDNILYEQKIKELINQF